MKPSQRFVSNPACAYFPCHKGVAAEDFNCLFCYCPCYFLAECPGTPRFLDSGVKDCSGCTLPHRPEGYDVILERLRRELASPHPAAPGC